MRMRVTKNDHRFSGRLTKNSDENTRMRLIFYSKFPPKVAHVQILVVFFFWSTDLKFGVRTRLAY